MLMLCETNLASIEVILTPVGVTLGFPGGAVVKILPGNVGDTRLDLLPGSGRSPAEVNGTLALLPGKSHG